MREQTPSAQTRSLSYPEQLGVQLLRVTTIFKLKKFQFNSSSEFVQKL